MNGPVAPPSGGAASRHWRGLERGLVVVSISAMLAMWIYAFFLAPREPINAVGDRAWATRAELRCAVEVTRRSALADFTSIEDAGPDALIQRADLVDAATDGLETMIDDLERTPPADPKGAGIVPLWIADWRLHIADRRAYTATLRDGNNQPFAETTTDEGLPLSEKIATFAQDNRMPSCRPPRDLSV